MTTAIWGTRAATWSGISSAAIWSGAATACITCKTLPTSTTRSWRGRGRRGAPCKPWPSASWQLTSRTWIGWASAAPMPTRGPQPRSMASRPWLPACKRAATPTLPPAMSTTPCASSPPTASSRGARWRSWRWALAGAWRPRAARRRKSRIRSTLPSGSRPSPTSQPGTHPGARGARAGTSSARPWCARP